MSLYESYICTKHNISTKLNFLRHIIIILIIASIQSNGKGSVFRGRKHYVIGTVEFSITFNDLPQVVRNKRIKFNAEY